MEPSTAGYRGKSHHRQPVKTCPKGPKLCRSISRATKSIQVICTNRVCACKAPPSRPRRTQTDRRHVEASKIHGREHISTFLFTAPPDCQNVRIFGAQDTPPRPISNEHSFWCRTIPQNTDFWAGILTGIPARSGVFESRTTVANQDRPGICQPSRYGRRTSALAPATSVKRSDSLSH